MVFESLLVEVLNRFLGPYVKNLDASQLKVGIWGGGQYLEAVYTSTKIACGGGLVGQLPLSFPEQGCNTH